MALVLGQQVLGQYLVETLIGKGAMGAVYRARHERLGRVVALKVLLGDSDAREMARFEREAQLLARVRHPNIVQILDYGLVDAMPCMVMEYIKGESLADRLYQVGALPLDHALDVIVGVLAGLDAIHTAGILHRDLKPSNISLAHGERETVKLLDFGIARSIEQDGPRLTHTGLVVGTPRYMSPEQLLNGKLDARSDVYSAALVLYEMLTGALPWDAETAAQPVRRMAAPLNRPAAPAALPPVPSAISDAVLAALARAPAQRPGSARAFFELLRKARGPVSRRKRVEEKSAPAAPSPPPAAARLSIPDAYSPTLEIGRVSQPGPPPASIQALAPSAAAAQFAPPPQGVQFTPSHGMAQHPGFVPPSGPPMYPPFTPPGPPPGMAQPPFAPPPGTPAAHGHGNPAAFTMIGAPPASPFGAPLPVPTVSAPPGAPMAAAPGTLRLRALLVARIDPSRLNRPDERQWLAAQVPPGGRVFLHGSEYWMVALPAIDDTHTLAVLSASIARVSGRFGPGVRVAFATVRADFAFPASTTARTDALPGLLRRLVEQLSAPEG